MIRDVKGEIMDRIPVHKLIVSVSDKSGLEELIPGMLDINPRIEVISTGGTYDTLKGIMTKYPDQLTKVEDYTKSPEMEGGLVKTLNPKIHGGILGERNNTKHQEYLASMDGDYIDMVIVNLYPFQDMIKKIEAGETDKKTGEPYNFESARGNIDIGGPTMIRAAAKNFLGCAAVCDPNDYKSILKHVQKNKGSTTFEKRAALAAKVFKITSQYDTAISEWAEKQEISDARKPYQFSIR
jgi:phosphoribosylaminoimidazolecarboxamide formyltransferase/IMP cyclohydrolase